jgi:light-regulated signal transduction histidine kinase (bacteriophytochrome)
MDNAKLFDQAQRSQDELKRSNAELRRVNQDLETFAYSAGHDLQEPLRTISLSAQLLQRHAGNLGDEGNRFLRGVLQGTERMQTLIQDLLSYTRATQQDDTPVVILDAAQVLSSVVENLRPALEQCGGTIVAAPLPRVAARQVHLTQLFQNLLGNALKYKGSAPPHVLVSATETEGWACFHIADNGIGIEPQFSEQIFGLFKRLHSRDQYPGSGIGLAICQRILEQYGGRIWLEESAPGKGSVFAFTLPLEIPR